MYFQNIFLLLLPLMLITTSSHQKNTSSWRAIISKPPVFSYLRNSSDSHLFTSFFDSGGILSTTLCLIVKSSLYCLAWVSPLLCLIVRFAFKALKLSCDYFNKLIYLQCHNGHTLCSTCKTRVHNRCPTCRQELGDIRCLALEKVAESLELPCKYYSLGCPEIFPYYSKLKHEAVCNFRPYNCPYAGSECSIVGDIPFLVSHLRDDHKVDMHTGCTFNHRYVKSNPREVENATWMLTVSVPSLLKNFKLDLFSLQDKIRIVQLALVRGKGVV